AEYFPRQTDISVVFASLRESFRLKLSRCCLYGYRTRPVGRRSPRDSRGRPPDMAGRSLRPAPGSDLHLGMVTAGAPTEIQGDQGAARQTPLPQRPPRRCLSVSGAPLGTATALCPPYAPAPPGPVSGPEGPWADPGDGLFPPHHCAPNN